MKRKKMLNKLRKLPQRAWNEPKVYKSLMVIPSGQAHESGWALMCIIGLDEQEEPIEIAATCADISLFVPADCILRNDMYYPNEVIHYWSRGHSFKVGTSLSSTAVSLVKELKE